MEITATFLIFLLFCWNIFVILRQKYRKMEYIFSKNEVKVLKHLADGEQHSEAPADLTSAQFYSALKSLKEKDMVYAAFLAGGEVCSSQIKPEGRAALEEFKMKEKKILRTALQKFGLTHEQYELLINAEASSIEETRDNNKAIIYLHRKGYLKKGFSNYGNRHWIITEEGQDVLDEIDDRLYGNDLSDSYQVFDNKEQTPPTENVNQSKEKGNKHNIQIAPKHITDVIKVFDAMCKLGYFKEEGGNASTKCVMEAFGEILHSDQLGFQYSTLLNKATKSSKNTFLRTYDDLREIAENFYDNRDERKIN